MVNPNKIAKKTMEFLINMQIPLIPRNYSKFFYAFLYIEENQMNVSNPNDIIKLANKIEKEKDLQKVIEMLEKRLDETAEGVSQTTSKIKEQSAKLKTEKDIEKVLEGLNETINITDGLIKFIYHQKQLVNKLKKELEAKEQEANIDPLTELLNRRAFDKDIRDMFKVRIPFSIAFIDLDDFKHINDTYGHQFGDEVLKGFAKLTKKLLRETDRKYRIGGEEFAILLPKASLPTAYKVVERLREAFEKLEFDYKGKKLHFTFSAGVTEFKEFNQCKEDPDICIKNLIEKVDKLLYKAKGYGKNIVMSG